MLAVGIAYLPEMIRTSSRSGGRKHIFVRADPHAILENANFVINSFLEFVVGFSEKVTNLSALIYNNFLKLPQRPFFWLLADSVFIIGAILVMIMVFRRKKIAVLLQNSGLIFALAFFLFNFLLLILLEVSRSIQMISLYIAFMLLLSHFLTRAQLLLRRIAVIALVLISLLMLWDYYPQSYFSFEQANWRSAGQYLSSYASPEDLIFFTGGRNGLYTLKYYCPETMNNLKYIRGHSWQQDPYQVDVQLFPQSQIQPYLQDMMGQYPKIWLVMMGGPATFSPQCPDLHPMETHCFGPQLTVFCLRMVKDK